MKSNTDKMRLNICKLTEYKDKTEHMKKKRLNFKLFEISYSEA